MSDYGDFKASQHGDNGPKQHKICNVDKILVAVNLYSFAIAGMLLGLSYIAECA